MPPDGAGPDTAGPTDALRRFTAAWSREISRAGFLPVAGEALDILLGRLTRRLTDSLLADAFDPQPAYEVGAALIAAHLTDPQVLAGTVTLIGTMLTPVIATDEGRRRLALVQAGVAAGYARALRAATLTEQERLGRAVLDAHAAVARALRHSEARLRAIFHGSAIAIGVSTMDGRIVQVNQAFADLLGYTPEELCRLTVPELNHPEDPPDMWAQYDALVRGDREHVRVEKAYYRKDRAVVWTELTASLLRDEWGGPELTIAMVEDITGRRRMQRRLEYQATHDPLTGLANRTLITERLAAVFADAAPQARVGLCYLDLDGFKRINETLGHQVGDELLVAVARRLLDCVPDPRLSVARMGGDEFVLLVPDSSGLDELAALAGTVLRVLSAPYQVGQHRMRISASIGVVESNVHETTAPELMKAADLTLYVAKSEGRGRWVSFNAERNARQAARYALAAALPDALDRREFSVVYQPLVSLADHRWCGVEALVRWQHPELGLLMPDRFITIAEETGVILSLGRWVLETACAQAAEWAREFPDVRPFVSVNMTVSQAHEPTLVEDIESILDRTGLDPRLLALELTESAVMDTNGPSLQALAKLADTGIRIAIDDFGTGYSNLAYLRRLPVQTLKLAGSFIDGLRDGAQVDPVDEQIVDTIIRLAHALGLSVTAEGIETGSQAARLHELGCDTGQGWLFARPMPAAELTRLLRDRAS